MREIGIITQYYDSKNYGGNLQAYALPKIFKKIGYEAMQISYIQNVEIDKKVKLLRIIKHPVSTLKKIILKMKLLLNKIVFRSHYERFIKNKDTRTHSFNYFNKSVIKHTEEIYDSNTISNVSEQFDAFITGSDMVWNVSFYDRNYFLSFVSPSKIKISYAASISMDSLNDEQKEIFRRSLKDFDAVSVREKSDVELIKNMSPVPVINTLDPTLLLSSDEWNEVCAEKVVDGKYIFCYFLGDNKKERKIAKEFAKRKGLKIVTLPHMNGYQSVDINFGDYQLWDVGPEKFLSLIKYAEYIFTDSFHAVIFSNIYNKQYFVFNRNRKGEMSSRIYNITELFDEQDRYCDIREKENLKYLRELEPINYNREFTKFEEMKKISIEFLKNSLGETK